MVGATPIRRLLSSQVLREMGKFMSVGFLSLALTLIIVRVASDRLFPVIADGKLRLLTANAIAFAVTLTNAFFLNSRFTFKAKHLDRGAYVRYLVVNMVAFAINSVLFIGFAWALAALRHENLNELHLHFRLGETLAQLPAIGIGFFWNFFMSRHWVFRPDPAHRETLVHPGH